MLHMLHMLQTPHMLQTLHMLQMPTNDSARDMMLLRPTRPKEVRSAVTPHVLAGKMMDPPVSVPNAKGTSPAAVAAAGPAALCDELYDTVYTGNMVHCTVPTQVYTSLQLSAILRP